MLSTKRSIFREEALQYYKQRSSRDVLPRYISPPVFLAFWIFILLGMGLLLVAWNIRLPVYQSGTAVIINARQTPYQGQGTDMLALVFFSPTQAKTIHQGMPIQLLLNSSQPLEERLTTVTTVPLSPQEIRDTYHLDTHLSLFVAQPSLVGIVLLAQKAALPSVYAGTLLAAQVPVGTLSLLAMVPIIGPVLGGSK